MDENLIAQAKAYAAQEGRSLSDLVGTYFARLADAKKSSDVKAYPANTALAGAVAPRRSSFYGLMQDSKLEESDYYAYLEQQHK